MVMSKYTITIEHDEDPLNPREEYDNMGTMLCMHKRYSLGDEHDYRHEDYDGWEALEAAITKEEDTAIILPLFLYDHSGITISTKPFSCRWDSSNIGFIFVSKDKVRSEYGVKRLSNRVLELAENVLHQEVKTYDQYLTGDVWGYIIKDENDEEIESCWGFHGEDYCREEAERVVAGLQEQDRRKHESLIRAQAAMPCCFA
jgi:hypothetical protein